MYVHLCSCKLDVLILLVSVDFKTSGRCFLKGGKYVTCANCVNFIIFSFRHKSRSIQLPVTIQGSNSKFNPLAAKLMDKNMSSVSVNSV